MRIFVSAFNLFSKVDFCLHCLTSSWLISNIIEHIDWFRKIFFQGNCTLCYNRRPGIFSISIPPREIKTFQFNFHPTYTCFVLVTIPTRMLHYKHSPWIFFNLVLNQLKTRAFLCRRPHSFHCHLRSWFLFICCQNLRTRRIYSVYRLSYLSWKYHQALAFFSLVCSKSLFFAKDEEKADHNVSPILFTWVCEWPAIFNTRKRYPEKNRRCIHAFTGESFSIWFYGQHNVYTIQVKNGFQPMGSKIRAVEKRDAFYSRQTRNEYCLILYSSDAELLRRFQALI